MRRLLRASAGWKGVMLVLLLVLIVLAVVQLALAKPGRATRSDIVATRTYLRALHRLRRAEAHDAVASRAAVEGLVGHVRSGCPNVLVGAPETEAIEDLRWQTLVQVSHADGEPLRHAVMLFAKRVQGLRWSNRKLIYYVHGEAEEARANAELVPPDICVEAKAIVASGYQGVPAIVERYDRRVSAANGKVVIVGRPHEKGPGSLEERILHMLKRYERPGEKRLVPRRPTEKQIIRAVKRFVSYAGEIITALGLPVPAPGTGASGCGSSQCGSPYRLSISAPAAVRRAGGRRLREFRLGRAVAAEAGCEACHRIGDAGNRGPGRALTHIGSRLSESEIRHAIVDAKRPMPSFGHLPPRKLRALVKFLALLR